MQVVKELPPHRVAGIVALALVAACAFLAGWARVLAEPSQTPEQRTVLPPSSSPVAAPHREPVLEPTPPEVATVRGVARELGGVAVRCPVGPEVTGVVELRPALAAGWRTRFPGQVLGQVVGGELTFWAPPGPGVATWKTEGALEGLVAWTGSDVGEDAPCSSFETRAELTGIHGVVQGADGPMVGVVVEGCGDQARTGSDGTFFVYGRTGPCSLYASSLGPNGRVQGPAVQLTLEAGADRGGVVLVVPPSTDEPYEPDRTGAWAENCLYWAGTSAELRAMARFRFREDPVALSAALELLPAPPEGCPR